jgi:hypothetical protein
MALVERDTLVRQLAPPLDGLLAGQLVDEFISLERRFVLRDWEPAELDGGQFAEILSRVLCHLDSGNVNQSKGFNECMQFLEDHDSSRSHRLNPRKDALHMARVLRAVYGFRSQRGAVHISPTYKANHMDAKFMIESVRWLFNEVLRVYLQSDREVVARTVRELLQFDVPCIGRFGDVIVVQRTDLTSEQEILVLLHYAGEAGFSRAEIGKYAMCSSGTVSDSLKKLTSSRLRQVVLLPNGNYRLSDLGAKRTREQMADKLLAG